jgi:flagellar assembly protein FliH
MSQPRPFTFGADFGDSPAVVAAPRRKRVYLAEEVDQVREAALREGEASAVAAAQQAQAQALAQIADAARQALGALAQVALEHKTGAAELALAAARRIADAALDRFPEAPLRAALDALSREIEGQPRLVVRMGSASETIQAAVEEAAEQAGFAGQIVFRPEPGPVRAAFALEWADGKAAFDPAAAAARIAETLEAALAAEGLHGEAITPASPGAR